MEIAKTENAQVIPVCAKIEEEIAELDDEDKQMFLDELGLKESGLDPADHRRLRPSWTHLLPHGGKPEVRAWTIEKGTKAPAGGREDPFGF